MASTLSSLVAVALSTWATEDTTTTTMKTMTPEDTPDGIPTWPCPWWRHAQHVLFQLANLCFAVSFLTPSHIKYHPWLLRTVVALGALLLLVWGATVVCHPDVVTWYALFFVINLGHLAHMTYRTYPFQFPQQYTAIYDALFAPFNVTRYQFKELAGRGRLEEVEKGVTYALEHETDALEQLAMLVSGRLSVYSEGLYLHSIEPNQFVNSPEFEADGKTVDKYQVTISAAEDSALLTWPVADLRSFLHGRPFLEAVFTNLLGRDITLKLYQVQDLLLEEAAEQPGTTQQRPRKGMRKNSLVHFRRGLSLSLSASQSRDLAALGNSSPKEADETANDVVDLVDDVLV